jgi:hypothetical protein
MEVGDGVGVLASDTRNVPDGAFVKDLEIMKAFSSYSDPGLKENLVYLQEMRLRS